MMTPSPYLERSGRRQSMSCVCVLWRRRLSSISASVSIKNTIPFVPLLDATPLLNYSSTTVFWLIARQRLILLVKTNAAAPSVNSCTVNNDDTPENSNNSSELVRQNAMIIHTIPYARDTIRAHA